MTDPGLKYHNNNSENSLTTSNPAATKVNKSGKKSAAAKAENLQQKEPEVENTVGPSSKRGTSSGDNAKAPRVGNGWSHELNTDDSAPLQIDLNLDDNETAKHKKLRSDDSTSVKSDLPTTADLRPAVAVKTESEVTNEGENCDDDQGTTTPRTSASPKPPPSGGGSFMAGSMVLSNSILDEVLNEKKMSILQSPEVIEFLQLAQLKRKSVKSELI